MIDEDRPICAQDDMRPEEKVNRLYQMAIDLAEAGLGTESKQ